MDEKLWGLETNREGYLLWNGCNLAELAATCQTPLHVVNEDRLRGNYQRFLQAFRNEYPESSVYYSYKTNGIPGVLQLLHEEGCGAEVISPYELWLASRLKVPPAETIYNGVNKSIEHIKTAIKQGIKFINIDSLDEADRLKQAVGDLKVSVDVGLRIFPGIGWKAQFGLQPEFDRLAPLARSLKKIPGINLRALHVHIGSGLRSTANYIKTLKKVCTVMRDLQDAIGIKIEYLDIGGGFGVPGVKTLSVSEVARYKLFNKPPPAPQPDACSSMAAFAKTISHSLKENCCQLGLTPPHLLLEPGRILTSDAQILLLSVREIKKRADGTQYALMDGGMQNIAFPLSYEYHHCFVANKMNQAATQRYHVMGPLCSPEDFLYRNWKLPELAVGDVLAIMDAGAYFTSFANNFANPRPGVVGISREELRWLRNPESFEHMVVLDNI